MKTWTRDSQYQNGWWKFGRKHLLVNASKNFSQKCLPKSKSFGFLKKTPSLGVLRPWPWQKLCNSHKIGRNFWSDINPNWTGVLKCQSWTRGRLVFCFRFLVLKINNPTSERYSTHCGWLCTECGDAGFFPINTFFQGRNDPDFLEPNNSEAKISKRLQIFHVQFLA